ncbi:MAG: hypothetical protein ACYC56_08460 [Candidatus Aquicultor sp.]
MVKKEFMTLMIYYDGEGIEDEILKSEFSIENVISLAKSALRQLEVDIPSEFYLVDEANIRLTPEYIQSLKKKAKSKLKFYIKTKKRVIESTPNKELKGDHEAQIDDLLRNYIQIAYPKNESALEIYIDLWRKSEHNKELQKLFEYELDRNENVQSFYHENVEKDYLIIKNK